MEALIQTVRIYSQDTGIEFSIEKGAVLIMKSGKRQTIEGIELQNQEKIRMHGEKETYNYLRILEGDTIKQAMMKEKRIKKCISGKKKNYWKQNYIAEITLNG